MSRKMTKEVRELVEKANKAMQRGTLKENEKLFYFIDSYLLSKKMHKGFNLYCWAYLENGDKWLKLAGGDDKHKTKEGYFQELETDIRQFYLD